MAPKHRTDTYKYLHNMAEWLIGLPWEERVASTVGSLTIARVTEFNPNLTTGLLHSKTIQRGDPRLERTDQFFYEGNDYGLPTRIASTGWASESQGVQMRETTISYDEDGLFPVSTTNAAGHTERFVYQPGLGVPAIAVDAQGRVTRFKYDGFGRLRSGTVRTSRI